MRWRNIAGNYGRVVDVKTCWVTAASIEAMHTYTGRRRYDGAVASQHGPHDDVKRSSYGSRSGGMTTGIHSDIRV